MDMPELVDVVEVEPLDGYRLRLVFEDGKRGHFDVAPYLGIGVFCKLEE